jgi:hypothetical protein
MKELGSAAPLLFHCVAQIVQVAYALMDKQLPTNHRDLTSKSSESRSTAADPICWPYLYFSTGC